MQKGSVKIRSGAALGRTHETKQGQVDRGQTVPLAVTEHLFQVKLVTGCVERKRTKDLG